MAIYVIGDLQGCYKPLQRLLKKVEFNTKTDKVWFAGDLISRGKHSLETLRFVKSLGDNAIAVLGNHDISLLAAAYGVFEPHRSLKPLLDAPDCSELIHWLQQRPLLHHDPDYKAIMVHAGISPQWDLNAALGCAKEAEECLRNADATWLAAIYGNKPNQWTTGFESDIDRQRYIVNTFTRMRYCHPDGSLEFKQKLSPKQVRKTHPELTPWFQYPKRHKIAETIYFGHWSTLGYYNVNRFVALDSGCVWGGKLTAVRIDTKSKVHSQVACKEYG